MKKIYSIIANGQVSLEGQVIEAGDCIGTLTTEQPIGNVQSLIRFGNCSLQPVASEPAMVKRKDSESKSKPLVPKKSEEESTVDPDALNVDDEAPAPEPQKAKEAEPSKEPEIELDASFASLDKKWAKALTVHGLTSRDEVAKFVNEGGDLKEVDGIGNKTKLAIEAWLK